MNYCVKVIAPEEVKGYRHLVAYAEIAESMDAGLEELGIYNARGKPIVIGGHLVPTWVPANAIIYNLEPECVLSIEAEDMLRKHVVWDYSPRNAEKLRRRNINVTHVVQPGYCESLSRIVPRETKDIDVLFYGSINARRAKIMEELTRRGYTAVMQFGVYGRERDDLMARSRLIINMHYYEEAKMLETVRLQYPLANGIPVISELSCDAQANREWGEAVDLLEYENLVDHIELMLEIPDSDLKQHGRRGYDWFRKRRQSKDIAAALGIQ